MRIVLDTNVVLSALLWRGAPHDLLVSIGQRSSIHLYSSSALLEELAEREATSAHLLDDDRGDEVAADHEEHIDADEPACERGEACVEQDHRHDRESAKSTSGR